MVMMGIELAFQINNYLDVSHLDDEPNPNLIRVGWSAFSSSLQLGMIAYLRPDSLTFKP